MKYKLAGRVVEFVTLYDDGAPEDMRDYIYSGDEQAQARFVITQREFDEEKERWLREFRGEIQSYLLSKMFYKWLLGYDATYFHSCAIEMDGWAYAFTGPSGTGKSTHACLWMQRFGRDRVCLLNDDKAFVRLDADGRAYACGSPWHGKVARNTNAEAPLAGICILEQAKANSISRVAPDEAATRLLRQIYLPDTEESLDKALAILEKLVSRVPVYRLKCNISQEAAQLAYETMRPEEFE